MKLQWSEENETHVAWGAVRCYRIRQVDGRDFIATIDSFAIGARPSLEAAKQLCQEHCDR